MEVDEILEQHGLTRDTATKYIEAITQMNQSETADKLDVSRDTINRYKKEFSRMTQQERTLLIASLFTEKQLTENTQR
jgi:DNA-binding XRE family transcriptional regulator